MASGDVPEEGAGGAGVVHGRVAAAARAARSVAARPAPAVPRVRRDARRVRLRADLPRQRAPGRLRLHGARHRVGVHALPQPRRVRLGRADRPRRGRRGVGRHLHGDVRARDAEPHHARADGAAARSAPGRRAGHAPGGHDHRDHHDRQQRVEPPVPADRARGRGRAALVPALRDARDGAEPGGPGHRAGRGRADHRGDHRPAGVLLRAGPARQAHRRGAAPGDAARAAARRPQPLPRLRGAPLVRVDASSTTSGRCAACPCSPRAS